MVVYSSSAVWAMIKNNIQSSKITVTIFPRFFYFGRETY